MRQGINKVVLAYSGGLDTSIILRWIIEEYGAEVVTYTADVGQGDEVEEAHEKALATGAVEAITEDRTPRSDGVDGLNVVRVLEGMQTSLTQGGQPVKLEQPVRA